MSQKPIFVATHPRACSTAFERVFMTSKELRCIHEPMGDAFYYGPERLSSRFEKHEDQRIESGFSDSTFKTVLDRIDEEKSEGKRLFIKDIMHYALPPNKQAATIAPSLQHPKKGVGTDTAITNGHVVSNGLTIAPPYPYKTAAEPQNPTVLPLSVLRQFHFTFLIRHPRYSIPSYFRCTVPPLAEVTGFYEFYPSEAGYDELRRTFDYLRSEGVIGPDVAGAPEKKGEGEVEICVVDADDLLNKPAAMIEAYCASVGINYNPDMLTWDSEEDHEQAKTAFEKWRGFHEDAINSTSLRPRTHAKTPKTSEQENAEWAAKFGDKDAKVIRETVDRNVEDYEYLKQFALKV